MLTNFKMSILMLLSAFLFTTSCTKDDEPTTSTTVVVYASNNSDGDISSYDVSDRNDVKSDKKMTPSTAADGIYFDAEANAVIQASRSSFSLEGYLNTSSVLTGLLNIDLTSSTKMDSPRELAVIF